MQEPPQQGSTATPHAPDQRCAVCGVRFEDAESDSCARESCRWAIQHRAAIGEVAFQALRLKAREALERRQARSALLSSFEKEDEAVWSEAVKHSRYTPHQLSLIRIPSGKTQITTLQEKRKHAFQQHLRETIAGAFASEDIPQAAQKSATGKTEASPDAQLIKDCCRLCGGGCCSGGGNHAHLSEESVNEVRALYPTKNATEICDLFITCLPEVSVAGSCIMHRSTGCALPRNLRSQTCNRYLCEGLRNSLCAARTNGESTASYVVQRRLDNLTWPSARSENPIIATHLLTEPARKKPGC